MTKELYREILNDLQFLLYLNQSLLGLRVSARIKVCERLSKNNNISAGYGENEEENQRLKNIEICNERKCWKRAESLNVQ
jgi:hypothetical protein